MSVCGGQTITVQFTTEHPTTRAAQNADALPVGTLVVDGSDYADVVAIANVATGVYTAMVTLPVLALGQRAQIRIAATIATVARVFMVFDDYVDAPQALWIGTSSPGSTTTDVKLDVTAILANDAYRDCALVILAGTGAGQAALIYDSAPVNITEHVYVYPPLTEAPDATSIMAIVPAAWVPGTYGKVLGAGTDVILGTGVQAQIAAGGLAANAIDAASLKADAVTKIQTGLATAAAAAAAVWAWAQRTLTGNTGIVTVAGPVILGGKVVRTTRGNDYYAADGASLDFSAAGWANLTGATIQLRIAVPGGTTFTKAMTAPVAGAGITQTVRAELSRTDTAALPVATLDFEVRATLAGAGAHVRQLVSGRWESQEAIV